VRSWEDGGENLGFRGRRDLLKVFGGTMNYLEHLQYEFRPFFYLVFGVSSYKNNHDSWVIWAASIVLIAAALHVLKARYEYRYSGDGRRK
jgi:hypothetical protein